MAAEKRRALIQHAIALDAIILATGVALLARGSALAVLASFLAGIAAVAWYGHEELGLFATGYAVVILGIFFGDVVDVPALTALACAGAAISALSRAVRRVTPAEEAEEGVAEAAPARAVAPFAFALPLLVLVIYADVSDTIMRLYNVPSLLQPIIALSAIVVWLGRDSFRPRAALRFTAPVLFALYTLVMFSTSVWATDVEAADARVTEAVKAVIICLLVASLTATWRSLRRGLAAIVVPATIFAAISIVQITTGRFMDALGGLISPVSGSITGELQMPRASGPPVNDPNFYARILLLAIPLAIALGMSDARKMRRFAWFGAATLIGGGILVTYSRGGMLAMGFVVALIVIALRIAPRKVAVAVAVSAVIVLLLPGDMAKARLSTLASLAPGAHRSIEADSSIEARKLFGRSAAAMFVAHPVTGIGTGNFKRHFRAYSNAIGSPFYNYFPPGAEALPHNLYFEIASETGLLGLITFGAAVSAALISVMRARRRLLARGDAQQAFLATSVAIAIAGYLSASVFLHESHLRYIGLFLGFAGGVARLARDE
jgi:putative inorganic carbon (HCO3(-)) transporter